MLSMSLSATFSKRLIALQLGGGLCRTAFTLSVLSCLEGFRKLWILCSITLLAQAGKLDIEHGIYVYLDLRVVYELSSFLGESRACVLVIVCGSINIV